MIVKGKRKAEFFLGKKLSDPKYTGKKFFVLSETGLRIFGGYKTKKEAKKRLGQVEFFKRRGNPASDLGDLPPGVKVFIREGVGGFPGKPVGDLPWFDVVIGTEPYSWPAMRAFWNGPPSSIIGYGSAYEWEDCGGYIVGSTQAEDGWGPLVYDILMELAAERGAMLVPDRRDVSEDASAIWKHYRTRRPDVQALPIPDDCVLHPDGEEHLNLRYTIKHPKILSRLRGADLIANPSSRQRKKKRAKKKATRRRRNSGRKDILPGGLADKMKPSDFCPRALAKGTKAELEHTSDPRLAQEIAMDHLAEYPSYYDALEKMERGLAGNPLPLPLGNPTPFWQRGHDWDQVLIQKDKKKRTRGQILEYYKKNAKKIWPYLDGQTVMVIFGRKKNDFVLRRKGPDGKYIKLTKLEGIDDPHSYEYWIHRRVIEFHPVITGKTTGLIWIDVDPYKKAQAKSMAKMQRQIRKAVPLMKRLLKDEFGVTKAYIWRSGKTDGGWHIEGDLPREMNVNKMRKKLRAALDKYFADDPDFTTTIAKPGQIRLDTTLTKTMGSLRAPYSYTVDGSQKLPVKVTGIAPSLKKRRKKAKRTRNPGLSQPDYDAMKREVERGVEPEFEPLGMGTTRQVYEISIRSGDPFIFKADFGPKDRKTQTASEISCIQKGKSRLFPEIYDYDPKGRWVEMEVVEPLDTLGNGKAIFWDLSGIDWDDFDTGFAGVDPKNAEAVAGARAALIRPGNTKAAKFFDELVRVSKACQLDTLDMGLLENWGINQSDGLKLIDLGGVQ